MRQGPKTIGWVLFVAVCTGALAAGCPASHDGYNTSSRQCYLDRDCTHTEVCTAPDAGADGGKTDRICYSLDNLTACSFPDAGVSYFCFQGSATCIHETSPERFGCVPANQRSLAPEAEP